MANNIKSIIKQAIDIHFHVGPEIIPRKFTVSELIKAEKGKIAGLVLKNHFYSTSVFIREVRDMNSLKLFGSVTLNNAVGGLNPEAIYASKMIADLSLMIWFPTINAENFLKQSVYEIAPEWISKKNVKTRKANKINPIRVIEKGELSEKTLEVLKAIKETNSILATGHLSWEESKILAIEARKMGIRVVITHPVYQRIKMPIYVQKELAKLGCFMEQCYSMYAIDKIPIKVISRQIQEVGIKSVILSSDMGQVSSCNSSKALEVFSYLLIKEGITEEEIYDMMVTNPKRLMGVV